MRLIIFGLIFTTYYSFSLDNTGQEKQLDYKLPDMKDKFKLSLTYNYLYSNFRSADLYGINFEIFLLDYLSINYSIAIGFTGKYINFHCYGGLAGGLYLISSNLFDEEGKEPSSDGLRTLGVICLFIPEGINFYVKSSTGYYLVPYINPLGFDFLEDNYTVSSGLGMKVEYPLNGSIVLSPYVGTKYLYKMKRIGFDIGAMFGIKF